MEYTPEMADELENLKNTIQGGKISVENALDLMQQTVDITEDDIDAVEALSQAVDNDDAIIDKAREIYSLDESKEVEEDFKFGGEHGLTMAGDEPTPVKVNKVKQELSGIASTMEDVFQAFNKEVQQKYPDIFQDKNLLSRIEMMAQQIKRLKNEVKGLNEVEEPTNSLAITVGITRRITGRITRFNVAMLPELVEPADAFSFKYLRVFSRITLMELRRVPFKPSSNASLVSPQRLSNNGSDI